MDRVQKAANLFSGSGTTDKSTVNLKVLMHNLEKLQLQETRIWWDCTTLTNYVSKEIIPRGLRIKKIPTTIFCKEMIAEWNEAITICSNRFMNIIIKYESKKLETLTEDISKLQKDLEPYKGMNTYTELLNVRNERIAKLEEQIMETKKKKKLQRDIEGHRDFELKQQYEWGRWESYEHTPKSILKRNKFQRKRTPPHKVTFSSSEMESDGESDNPTTSNSTPGKATYYKKTKKAKRKAENPGGGETYQTWTLPA
ncbi:uncharacterized protein LOC130282769 [Hyla sarda]|uniref:uncharacterized protein LOC130282769 n=1 Tax=Hyla sarda TaxID=327740 RepID=UPI0024C426E8|nr:uncharacterized protein LOC130282769 [Hyla sarda]XP_056387411.1 uncharacterized protein LOC130282769 [Hyla sarda]